MAKIDEQSSGKKEGEIRYLTPLNIDTNTKKKYCRFKRSGIKYIDYKDPDFLLKFVNVHFLFDYNHFWIFQYLIELLLI